VQIEKIAAIAKVHCLILKSDAGTAGPTQVSQWAAYDFLSAAPAPGLAGVGQPWCFGLWSGGKRTMDATQHQRVIHARQNHSTLPSRPAGP